MFDKETVDHAYAMEEAAEAYDRDLEDEDDFSDEDPEDEDDFNEDEEDWEDYDEHMRHRAWEEELFFPDPEEVWA